MDDVHVARNDEGSRYELFDSVELASFVTFNSQGDTITFMHTETRDAFKGRGLAERLVRDALDDVRGRGEKVVAQCPYVKEFIEKNAEYHDLLAA
jgi:uncharacterized protein